MLAGPQELAGLAARSARERVAAQEALSDLPLATFLSQALVPYEADAVTRLIEQGAPVVLVFQSIAGTEAANRSFGIDLALLGKAYVIYETTQI